MKKTLLLLFTLSFLSINAQITYEKGYFIDNNDNRIECYIKNVDWGSSPNQISYKFTLNDDSHEASISNIQEFYVYDTEHYYKRFNLFIDESVVTDFNSSSRALSYKDKITFLRVIVAGGTSLYEYPGTRIFFFENQDKDIQQLEYKVYVNQESIKSENRDYRKQLYESLKCDKFSTDEFLKLEYKRKDLTDLFSSYNECNNSGYKVYDINKTPLTLNFNVSLGANFTSLESDFTIIGAGFRRNLQFDSQTVITPGSELELALPFNKNKWAFFLGASYHYYSANEQQVIVSDTYLGDLTFEYSYLEVPIGIRHYMYLNPDYKLFLNAAFAPILHLSNNNDEPFELSEVVTGNISFESQGGSTNSAFIIGAGLNIKKKYSVTLNYYASRKINNVNNFSNDMSGAISLIASYTIF